MTTITVPRAADGSGLLTGAISVAGRTLRKFARSPQLIGMSVANSAIFLVVFRYIFGGAIHAGAISYPDFLIPGFVTTMVLFQGMGAAAGAAEDIAQGFFDRLRSLPVPRAAIIAGRVLADTVLIVASLVFSTAIGFAVGFRLHGSVASGLAAFALCVAYAFAFTWLFILIGLVAGNPQAAQGMTMIVFPLAFVSSAYVPSSTMPGWLRPVADNQPLTIMVNAVRHLTEGVPVGHGTGYEVWLSLGWAAVIVAICAPLATVRFSRG